jgi:glycine/D-amino acid oxidase-like deaminating enzyme
MISRQTPFKTRETAISVMAETADVVIIGGGIVGSSVAYHLTEMGCRNVVIVEREAQQ